MQAKKLSHLWIITIALLVIWGALLIRVNDRLLGHADLIWMVASTRNMNQFGPEAVHFLPLRDPGPTRPDDPEHNWYYLHHPPTIVWIHAISAQLFGVNSPIPSPKEISVRMIAYIATMLSLAMFYVLVRRLMNANIALISFFLYAITPLVLYFGRQPHFDILLMPVIYFFALIFINWMRRYSFRRSLILLFTAIFLMWLDWPAAFYLAAFGLYAMVFGENKHRRDMIIIGVLTLLATLSIFVMYEVLRPGTIGDIWDIIELRTSTSNGSYGDESFTAMQFIRRIFEHMFTAAGVAVLIFGLIGILRIFLQKKTRNIYMLLTIIITPFVFMAIVPNAFFVHDFYKIHFLPGFSAAAGALLYAGWNTAPDTLLTRYIKPFIVAICVSSFGVTLYWTYNLHMTAKNNTFERDMIADLPLYTEADDTIASNYRANAVTIEYYAYREILWGVPVDEIVNFVAEQESIDLHYILCLSEDTVDSYDGTLSEYDYVVVGQSCRLIHIEQ